MKPIREETQYNYYNDNNLANFWRQQPQAPVNYSNEYQRLPIRNDNLSFYGQLLRDENEPYQRELNNDTEAGLTKRQWNMDLFNKMHNQRGYNQQLEGRPIIKTENSQMYDLNLIRSSIFQTPPFIPMQPDIVPISHDYTQYSPNDGYAICTFCKKNGERPSVYTTHAVRAKVGKKYIVTCPILRRYTCKECGAMGDNSHTM